MRTDRVGALGCRMPQKLVAQLAIEALNIAVFPGIAGVDVSSLGAGGRNLFAHDKRNKFLPVVRADVFRRTTFKHQVREHVDDVARSEPARHAHGERLARKFINHAQHPRSSRLGPS